MTIEERSLPRGHYLLKVSKQIIREFQRKDLKR
jgi:hypothetical protein